METPRRLGGWVGEKGVPCSFPSATLRLSGLFFWKDGLESPESLTLLPSDGLEPPAFFTLRPSEGLESPASLILLTADGLGDLLCGFSWGEVLKACDESLRWVGETGVL